MKITKHGKNKIEVNLSSFQESPVGRIVGHLYYFNFGLLELAPESFGFPHNGGYHTLNVRGSKEDVAAWFELVIEHYNYQQHVIAIKEFQTLLADIKTNW